MTVATWLASIAAVSVALHVPFRLPVGALKRLAGRLAEPAALVQAARNAVTPLHAHLSPALLKPQWKDDLSEEYFVFQLPPGNPSATPGELLGARAGWSAGLILLETGPLSAEAIADALRLHLGYSPDDLFVPNWAAAVLLDRDCDETLQAIEFANLQLLEYRHIDNRLDDTLAGAYRLRVANGKIEKAWLAFGGMAVIPKRATEAETVLLNSGFTAAAAALAKDFQPIDDWRGSGLYRLQVAANLLRRLELRIAQPTRPVEVEAL